ncbi:heptaprenyl diphosphate synthase component 1 [Paenibacillus sp. Marseille-Q4541]|uniref:heptaprenyl diphosphate synthase component 1 n=1 Tax=Paenibacillus sp. Marseille-Q4541 TaxID=2831522 RepID=UPI001BA741A8|nr:heptaprenyl diphosphate synthase component 1 [Paenibacillus sp. Marseille-Q4541]
MISYRVPHLAKKYTDYDMIQRHTELPLFPNSRVRLLYTFLNQGQGHSAEDSELFSLVTALVQMGLDTHEMIDVQEEDLGEQDMRSRQLKVLGGDFFSSRFYQLLAQAGQIAVIASLSEGICRLNERKMSLYDRMKKQLVSCEEYVHESVQLKKQLFLSFNGMISKDQVELYDQLLTLFSLLDTLVEEIEVTKDVESSRARFAYLHIYENENTDVRSSLTKGNLQQDQWNELTSKHKTVDVLMDKLSQSVPSVQRLLETQTEDQLLRDEVKNMLEPYLTYRA